MNRVFRDTAKTASQASVRSWIPFLVLVFFVPPARGDLVQEAVDKVSMEQYRVCETTIENMGLGRYGGRNYHQGYRGRDGWAFGGAPGNLETQLYLTDQFTSLGLNVSVQGMYRNVVAEWPGVQTPQEIYIVCAHYDTTSGRERPGGDDNASGTAGVLEAARVLTQYRFGSSLRFIAFNAEEDWMKGSQEYVNALPEDANIVGVINLDMILRPAWDSNSLAPVDLEVQTVDVPYCVAWAKAFSDAAAAYVPTLAIDPNSHFPIQWYAGDQGPFLLAGYAAFIAIENTAEEVWYLKSNVYYHSALDASNALANDPLSPSGVTYDYEFAANVVKATVATLALQAGIVAPVDPNRSEPPKVGPTGQLPGRPGS